MQIVWECILPINIPRTFLASLCDLFRFSSRFYVFYFRIWITSGFECVQPCRCARRACVRACARPHYLSCWHGNRRQMNSCFAAGDALLADGVHYSLCCRWINSVFPWITFFPAVRGYRYVRVICVCMCSRPFAVEFYYKFDVEVCFFLKSSFYIRQSGVVGSRDVH